MFFSKEDKILLSILFLLLTAALALSLISSIHYRKAVSFPAHNKQVEQEIEIACTTQDTHEDLCRNLHEWMKRVDTIDPPSKEEK